MAHKFKCLSLLSFLVLPERRLGLSRSNDGNEPANQGSDHLEPCHTPTYCAAHGSPCHACAYQAAHRKPCHTRARHTCACHTRAYCSAHWRFCHWHAHCFANQESRSRTLIGIP